MTAIKERLIGAITIMDEEDAEQLWRDIERQYIIKKKNWKDIEEVEPTEDEIAILDAYEKGDERYKPYISLDDLTKELSL